MYEYAKIETVFNRDLETHKLILGKWRLPEFEYLQNNRWLFTEKIDGTNIRIGIEKKPDDTFSFLIGGRTDKAQMYGPLLNRLNELFTLEKMLEVFPDADNVTLYGEGYGPGIQKSGKFYSDHCDFILFDIRIGNWWLKWVDVVATADKFGIKHAPVRGVGTLNEAIDLIRNPIPSQLGEAVAEGLVLRPIVDLMMRNGQRVIAKIKTEDFEVMKLPIH